MIRWLLSERKEYHGIPVPSGLAEKRRLLRSLMNLRPPAPADEGFWSVQDAYLEARLAERGVTKLSELTPVRPGLYLWKGDITTLAAEIAVQTVQAWQRRNSKKTKVIFNVFKQSDYVIYKRLLG